MDPSIVSWDYQDFKFPSPKMEANFITCLTELSDATFIRGTTKKAFGHLWTWTGGAQKAIDALSKVLSWHARNSSDSSTEPRTLPDLSTQSIHEPTDSPPLFSSSATSDTSNQDPSVHSVSPPPPFNKEPEKPLPRGNDINDIWNFLRTAQHLAKNLIKNKTTQTVMLLAFFAFGAACLKQEKQHTVIDIDDIWANEDSIQKKAQRIVDEEPPLG